MDTAAAIAATDRRPNTRLRERARARGWASARDLAEHLDRQARHLGLNVVFDERTVRRWLSGHSRADGVQSLKVDTAAQDMRARLHRLRRDGVPGADDLEQRAHTTWTPARTPTP
jgi:hypothetical protein